MKDPYETLGIARNASDDQIKRAYRGLAKQHHPDLNPGNSAAAERFKDITAAYDLLSDSDQRGRFDRGEIDASGAETPPRGFYNDHAEGPFGTKYGNQAGIDLSDLFGGIFGSDHRAAFKMRGADVSYALTIDFVEAAKGGLRRISLAGGETVDLKIPAGTTDGQILRLKGKGQKGTGGGPSGDGFVEIRVQDHPHLRRDGADIRVTVPVTLAEAIMGGKIQVPTIDGLVAMTVPAGSNTGTVLRLKGRGVPRHGRPGDQYVRLEVILPDPPDSELRRFVEGWPGRSYSVREGQEMPE